jgi:hypothetical protein
MDELTAALGVEEQEKVAHLIETVRGGAHWCFSSANIPHGPRDCDRS